MSTPSDQRFVLDLLETGKIDTSEAEWLLETIHTQSTRRPATPYSPDRNNKIILEIDADQENLQMVIKTLNQALCPDAGQEQKSSFLTRLARRTTPKATAH